MFIHRSSLHLYVLIEGSGKAQQGQEKGRRKWRERKRIRKIRRKRREEIIGV